MKRKSRERGFTLVEVIVVIGIVGGLIAILITSFTTTLKRTRDGRRKADLAVIQTAIENYKMDFGEYPINDRPCGADDPRPCEVPTSITYTDPNGLTQPVTYLKNSPKDPLADKPNSQYYYCYVPSANSPRLSYTLSAVFELESSECPGQPTGTPTPTPRPPGAPTATPTPGGPTNTPTPTQTPGGICNTCLATYTPLYNGTGSCCSTGELFPNSNCAYPAAGVTNYTAVGVPPVPPIANCVLPASYPYLPPNALWWRISAPDPSSCSDGPGRSEQANCTPSFGRGAITNNCNPQSISENISYCGTDANGFPRWVKMGCICL